MGPKITSKPAIADDAELVRRALVRDETAIRTIMAQHNRRLYRIARGILHSDSEAEDAVQEAYVHAFTHLNGFRGESTLATWLSRITINEALLRLRRERPTQELTASDQQSAAQIIPFPHTVALDDPERTMAQREILRLVEQAADDLPANFRAVFIMRVVEGLSIEETAALLNIRPETVKTRLHRARLLMREQLEAQIGPLIMEAFPFAGRRCERLTAMVLQRLGLNP
jgi:RNA polymerase sigma-70 factor, ECF subfamily